MQVKRKSVHLYSTFIPIILVAAIVLFAGFSLKNKINAQNIANKPAVLGIPVTYYVSTTGNDNNSGTQTSPFKTFAKASSKTQPGDNVMILPGTYKEKLIPANSGVNGGYITYTATPGTVTIDGTGVSLNTTDYKGDGLVQIIGKSYIKIQNLTIKNSLVNCVNISSNDSAVKSTNLEIANLTIQNCKKVGIKARQSSMLMVLNNKIKHIDYSSGIGVWNSEDVTVDGNNIDTPHWYHECQGAYDEGLSIASVNRFVVKNNTLDYTETTPSGYCSNAQRLGIDIKESSQNGSVYNNKVTNFDAGGIYVDGWNAGANGTATLNHINIYQNYVKNGGGILVGCEQATGVVEYVNIYNNIVVNSYFAGIQVRGAYGNGLRKNIGIYNNIVYGADAKGGNGGAGIYVTTAHLASNNSEKPVIIKNNISNFYFLSSGGGYVGQIRAGTSTMANLVAADHNIVYGPMTCSQEFPNCVEVGSRTTVNPSNLFVNPSSFDFHHKGNSPAIDAGVSVSFIKNDYDNINRPQNNVFDIGAYELTAVCTSVAGTWTYGTWGTCSVTCGTGTQTRTATCTGAKCGGTCSGTPVQSQACNTQVCPTPTPTATPTATKSEIEIYAAGQPANGVYPTLELWVDDVKVDYWTNVKGNPNTRDLWKLTHTMNYKIKSASQVKIKFSNDGATSSEDRNLLVDRIVIDGVTYQSESANIYSTGAYNTTAKTCSAGYLKTEWLVCNGYFRY